VLKEYKVHKEHKGRKVRWRVLKELKVLLKGPKEDKVIQEPKAPKGMLV
jgi:hypothetical protein